MFGSQGRGGAGSNPFAAPQETAAPASNPFASGGGFHATPFGGFGGAPTSAATAFGVGATQAPAVATAFGQPAVRPKKKVTRPAATPDAPAAFGSQATAFGRQATTFGSTQTTFGNQPQSQLPPPGGRHATAFGGASQQQQQQATAFGSQRALSGNQSAAFKNHQTQPGNQAAAFGNQQAMSGNQAANHPQTAFGGHATTFGNQAAGPRVHRKKTSPADANGGSTAPSKADSTSASVQPGVRPKKARAPKDAASTSASSRAFGRESMGFGALAAPSFSSFPAPSTTFGSESVGFGNLSSVPRERRKAKAAPSDEIIIPSSSSNEEPTAKAELASAANLDGTCIDMCSPAERELHIRVDELSVFEKCFPDQPGRESELIIKRFQRSSADHKLDIPSEVRPPGVLRRTQLYIEQEIMDRERAGADPRLVPPRVPDLIELYNFCWDRFRMIRKDFVLQNYRGAGGRVHPIVLDVHERVARYHILSEHELIEIPTFVAQQNMEQLGQTLKSLNELYDESRNVGDPRYLSPFEAEFRAYFILCALDNGRGLDVLKFVKGLHRTIVESAQVKFAMKVFVARHTNDYFQFFSLLRQATYLQSCLLFRYIPSVRSGALQRMNRAFRNQPYPLADLMELLCFDDLDHAGAICQHHGLEITQQDENDDGSLVVQFGGDFETDIQLRKNKRPLPVQGSHVFVGQKQGEYLRRDVCRGVTEYYPDEYPPLSHLIQELEASERARMYPTRPVYQDEYSLFANYSAFDPQAQSRASSTAVQSSQQTVSSNGGFHASHQAPQQLDDQGRKLLELDSIARRKAELERSHQMALQRIAELQRAKEAKALAAREHAPAHPPTARLNASLGAAPTALTSAGGSENAEDVARKRAAKEAELQRVQEELESKLREQEKQRQLKKQRELEELEKKRREEAAAAAAAAKAVAEAERLAKEAEARRLAIAAEEKRRREAEKRAEEARRRAAEEELKRQREVAEEQARQRREAALEAKRQAELARERAERKRQLRIKKQLQAIMQLRFHMWKKYVTASKALPPPVKIDPSRFVGGPLPLYKPKSTIQWLFKDASVASSIGTRLRNPSETIQVLADSSAKRAPEVNWGAVDVLSLVGPLLRKRHADASAIIRWKLVLGDLVDNQSSSFGAWCASRLGVAPTGAPTRILHSSESDANAADIAVCCRFVDAASMDTSSDPQLQSYLSGVSALLLSLSLSEILETGKRQRWMRRVERLSVQLAEQTRVVVSVLLFANVSPSLQSKHAVTAIETCVRELHAKVEQIVDVEFALAPGNGDDIMEENSHTPAMTDELVEVLTSLARRWVTPSSAVVVGLKEVLEASVGAASKRCAKISSPSSIQAAIQLAISRLLDDLKFQQAQANSVETVISELEGVTAANIRGTDRQWESVLTVLSALKAARIDEMESPTAQLERSEVCNHFFARIAAFIDRLFAIRSSSVHCLSTFELKKLVHSIMVPVHERLVMESTQGEPLQLAEKAAAARLPWGQVFQETYSAFFETLDDLSVSVPANWRSARTRELLSMESAPMPQAEPRAAVSRKNGLLTTTSDPALLLSTPAALPFGLKRSFGVALASSSVPGVGSVQEANIQQKQPRYVLPRSRQEDPRVERLCQEIARERAASASFQQMLRREVGRYNEREVGDSY